MVLPILIRSTQEVSRCDEIRRSAAAGFSRTARGATAASCHAWVSGGAAVGSGATAETAALIFTSGYVDRMPGHFWIRGARSQSTFTTSP